MHDTPLNIPYMKENGYLKVKDGHLSIALSLDRDLEGKTSNLFQFIWQAIYYKINEKKWKKHVETVSSLGTG